MTNLIEETDRQQQTNWRRFLLAFFLAGILLIVRYIFGTVFREQGLNSRPIGIAVLVATVALVAATFAFCVSLALQRSRIQADPALKEALVDNELVNLHIVQSWRPAFFGAVATPFAFLLISAFHQFDDLLLVALATAAVGSGAFLTSLHLKSTR